ncbi:hypothetical protein Cantr_00818 [Candida viswanathii]|uniref:Uncharacterized protein n=1 Tax=Candida viswanathii TaxID=5486 RepID=A0A367YJ88_9ASCO|nr:hypothetical protein Cantr_00818 [Candida viswanathii]
MFSSSPTRPMTQISDLPGETIEQILSYFSRRELRRLTRLPVIGNYATKAFFKEVWVDDDYTLERLQTNIGQAEMSPCISASEYLDLTRVHRFKPKVVSIDKMEEALKIARSLPTGLDNVRVEVLVGPEDEKHLTTIAEEFQKRPFPIELVIMRIGKRMNQDIPAAAFKDIQFLNLPASENYDLSNGFTSDFPNLSSLNLGFDLKILQLDALPRTLISLYCTIQCEDGNRALLGLPDKLKTLSISTTNSTPLPIHGDYDISHLADLEELHFSTFPSSSGCIQLVVPPSIKDLKVDKHNRIVGELPKLVKLAVIMSKLYVNEYPQSLEEVSLPASSLYQEVELFLELPARARQVFQLPKGLRTLNVDGGDKRIKGAFLDFERSECNRLEELQVRSVKGLKVFGNLPRALTKISIIKTPTFDLHLLAFLENLQELEIVQGHHGHTFSYHLPSSLKTLKLVECGLSKVFIKGESLLYVSLQGNEFTTLGRDTFVVPETVRELDVCDNKIARVANLPAHLEELYISSNRISSMEIGKYVRVLDLAKNSLGSSIKMLDFPAGLEQLDLTSNDITFEWLRKLNLRECPNLTELCLSKNNFPGLDPQFLPPSVVRLDLSACNIIYFAWDFQQLDRLERISLGYNNLCSYFMIRRKERALFGDAIRFVNVRGNNLKREDVEALMLELSKAPNFDVLSLEPDLLTGLPEGCEPRRRNIQKVIH